MSTNKPVPHSDTDIPAYEQALIAEHGAEAVARYRADQALRLAYGDRSIALAVGDAAPRFVLGDSLGTRYRLQELVNTGPLVMIFYRGGWCPFCNVQLRAFQLARSRLRALGASVVLIAPQRAEQGLALVERHALQFPILSDAGNEVARRYGISFTFDAALIERHLAEGINLSSENSAGDWSLPMPATFVIDHAGIIRYAFVSDDYTRRSEPADVLAVLQRIARR